MEVQMEMKKLIYPRRDLNLPREPIIAPTTAESILLARLLSLAVAAL
jgi:hypothetical protein